MDARIARIAVATGPGTIEIMEVPSPATKEDDGILLIETNGVCGSDVELLDGSLDGYPLPMALGHEPAGRIVDLGPAAAKRWGVQVGDRVAVSSQLHCQRCTGCIAGRSCDSFPGGYGSMPASFAPGLWGGFATHMYLSPAATLLRVEDSVTTADLAFHNPLANGFEWSRAGNVRKDDAVLVLGTGPRGIACALAALFEGAGQITLAGLAHDANRLAMAREMGVHSTVVVESTETDELHSKTGDHDVVIDTTPRSESAVRQAVAAAKIGGQVVLCGLKGAGVTVELEVDAIVRNRLTLTAPKSKSPRSFRRAIEALNSGRLDLSPMTTGSYPLDRTKDAIESLRSTDPQRPLHVRVDPQLRSGS